MPDCVVSGIQFQGILSQVQHTLGLFARFEDSSKIVVNIFKPLGVGNLYYRNRPVILRYRSDV